MTGGTIFEVASIGIPEREARLVRGILSVSKGRVPSFSQSIAGGETNAQLFIVDMDNAAAVLQWQRIQHARGKPPGPTVLLTGQNRTSSRFPCLRRPFVASRLLVLLEELAVNELGFVPPLAIEPEDLAPTRPALDSPQLMGDQDAKSAPFSALVVDDSLPVRVQMDLALRPLTSDVDFAETGEKALELVDARSYDIVFLDIVLPGIDGYRVCKAIKDRNTGNRTPVIMLTGNSSPADRIKGKLAGCDTYLIKPVRHAVFQEVVENYLPQLATSSAPAATGA